MGLHVQSDKSSLLWWARQRSWSKTWVSAFFPTLKGNGNFLFFPPKTDKVSFSRPALEMAHNRAIKALFMFLMKRGERRERPQPSFRNKTEGGAYPLDWEEGVGKPGGSGQA